MKHSNKHDNLLRIGFEYETELRDINGKLLSRDFSHNIYPTQGLNAALNVLLGAQAKVANWYIGIFEANYTPVLADTAATITANSTECVAYDEAARPIWTPSTSTVGVINNFAAPALFTLNANKTVYGAFISSSLTKAGTAGILVSAAAFTTPQVGQSGNVLTVKAACTLANA